MQSTTPHRPTPATPSTASPSLDPWAGLYIVLTNPPLGYERVTAAAVEAAVPFVQLRMKDRPRPEILAVGHRLRALTRGSVTKLIVNDDVLAAAEIDADGVHLGQQDMSITEARALWPSPGKIFGLSTHDELQAKAALSHHPDYVGVGPLFPTNSKRVPDPVLGVARAGAIVRSLPIPAVAIGGIDLPSLAALAAEGIRLFGVIRAVGNAEDPLAAIRMIQKRWSEVTEPRRSVDGEGGFPQATSRSEEGDS